MNALSGHQSLRLFVIPRAKGQRLHIACILDIGLPEVETMESAEQLIAALFENVSLEESKDGRDSGKPCEEKGSAS